MKRESVSLWNEESGSADDTFKGMKPNVFDKVVELLETEDM